ncbi:MAG: hypothetical protein ABUT20_45890 [Bacteroidota bacterium]
MHQDDTASLFEVRLNQKGIDSIRKFVKIAKWIMLLIIIGSFVSLTDAFVNYYLAKGRTFYGNRLALYLNGIYPFLVVVYFFLTYIQSYNFLKTARHLSAAIDNNNEESFNRAFLFLYRNAIFGLVALVLFLVMVSFRFFVLMNAYYNK